MSEKPTYEELEKRIQELEEAELKSHHHYLEELVKNRTTKLLEANEQLKREIKERKQLEKSLKESEAQLRLITDNLPIIISHIDKDLKYLFVNKFYYDRSKLSINIIGKNVIDVIGEEAFNRALPYMKKTLSSGEPISFINRSTHTKNNKLIIFETNYIPSVVNGKVESFFCFGNGYYRTQTSGRSTARKTGTITSNRRLLSGPHFYQGLGRDSHPCQP